MSRDFPLYKYYFEVNVIKGRGTANRSSQSNADTGAKRQRGSRRQDLVRCHSVSGLGIKYTFKSTNQASMLSHQGKSLDKSEYKKVSIKKGLYLNDPSSWANLRKAAFENRGTRSHLEDLYCENVIITLKSIEEDQVVMTWVLQDAFVTSWNISDFNSMESAIAEETVEFEFDRLDFT